MRNPMVRTLLIALAGCLPLASPTLAAAGAGAAGGMEPDLERGKRLNRQCALCHGLHAQGVLGGKYPRIAGFPEYYTTKAIERYLEGKRSHAAMLVVGGLRHMDPQDVRNLAAYITSIDLKAVAPLDVPTPPGADLDRGADLFKDDCRTCHGREGQGNARKESPPLAGQYDGYLLRQIGLFKNGKRVHANDPEDETFAAYDDRQILDIVGFVTTLDDPK